MVCTDSSGEREGLLVCDERGQETLLDDQDVAQILTEELSHDANALVLMDCVHSGKSFGLLSNYDTSTGIVENARGKPVITRATVQMISASCQTREHRPGVTAALVDVVAQRRAGGDRLLPASAVELVNEMVALSRNQMRLSASSELQRTTPLRALLSQVGKPEPAGSLSADHFREFWYSRCDLCLAPTPPGLDLHTLMPVKMMASRLERLLSDECFRKLALNRINHRPDDWMIRWKIPECRAELLTSGPVSAP